MNHTKILLTLSLLLTCLSANAEMTNPQIWYGGINLFAANKEIALGEPHNKIVSDDSGSTGIDIGFVINKNLAIEASYKDLGSISQILWVMPPCPQDAICIQSFVPSLLYEVSISSYSLQLEPRLPFSKNATLYGKAGFTSYDVNAAGVNIDSLDNSASYGLGIEFHGKESIAVRIGYEALSSNINGISLSFLYKPK